MKRKEKKIIADDALAQNPEEKREDKKDLFISPCCKIPVKKDGFLLEIKELNKGYYNEKEKKVKCPFCQQPRNRAEYEGTYTKEELDGIFAPEAKPPAHVPPLSPAAKIKQVPEHELKVKQELNNNTIKKEMFTTWCCRKEVEKSQFLQDITGFYIFYANYCQNIMCPYCQVPCSLSEYEAHSFTKEELAKVLKVTERVPSGIVRRDKAATSADIEEKHREESLAKDAITLPCCKKQINKIEFLTEMKKINAGKYSEKAKENYCSLCHAKRKYSEYANILSKEEFQSILPIQEEEKKILEIPMQLEEKKKAFPQAPTSIAQEELKEAEYMTLCCKNKFTIRDFAMNSSNFAQTTSIYYCPFCSKMCSKVSLKKIIGEKVMQRLEMGTALKCPICKSKTNEEKNSNVGCPRCATYYHTKCLQSESPSKNCGCQMSYGEIFKPIMHIKKCMFCQATNERFQELECGHRFCGICLRKHAERKEQGLFLDKGDSLTLYCKICKGLKKKRKYIQLTQCS